MRPASALGSWTRLVAGHVPRYRRSTSAATVAGCPGNAGWRGLAPAAVVAAGLFCAPSCVASELSEPARQADNEAAERALTALRAAWFGEIAQLTSTARSLAMAADCADFVVRPNLPYVRDNFRREQLAAARIDTVLIVNGAGRPLFWRRVEPGRHVGFADATAFLAGLPRLPRAAPPGVPAFAAAVELESGASLVVAVPIPAPAGRRQAGAWLVVARKLDAPQWRRYADAAHVNAIVVDRREWPSDVRLALDQPLTPVVRIGVSDVRGFLSVPDLRGNSFQAFSVTVPRSGLVSAAAAVVPPRNLAAWLPLAAVVACGAGVTPIVLRRRSRAATGTKQSAGRQPSRATPPDPLPEGAEMPPRSQPTLPSLVVERHFAAEQSSGSVPPAAAPVHDSGLARRPDADAPADTVAARRLRLRAALTAIDIAFRYQPQMDLLTGRVSGVEALVFLKGAPDDRAPTSLVTQLEAAGLGLPLAERWLQDICSERRRWRHHIGADFPVGMPVSMRTLEAPGFLPLVLTTLADFELPARFLELEVPESALDGGSSIAGVLAAACEAGVLLAIDGFNGARSSLQALAALPITKLRVDLGPIGGIGSASRPERLFDAIIGVARGLEIPVCATRVDSTELAIAVERRGCALGQGIEFGRPSDGEQFLALVRGSGVDTASLPMAEVQEGLRQAAETATA